MTNQQILFIGWDVGGWNCDKNRNSRDALVILDWEGKPFGKPCWNNLRETINTANTARDFVTGLILLCKPGCSDTPDRAILAIDAPLRFPEAFTQLINDGAPVSEVGGRSTDNPYLYRFTERQLADEGITPLSSIKDMIGSQATKAMHVVSKFTPKCSNTGVWIDDDECLTVIETYPRLIRERLGEPKPDTKPGKTADINDAKLCARVAHDFCQDPESLKGPSHDTPCSEGWIWAPKRNPSKNS